MMRQKRKQNLTIIRLLGALALPLLLAVGIAGAPPARAAALVNAIVTDPLTGVALDGYDPVTYFTGSEPQAGGADFAAEWGGVTWYFTSPANRDVFLLNPEIYAPQYGGHCVTSLSRGYLSDGKPRLYAITGMKLYLFYSIANREAFFASTGEAAIAQADQRWPALAAELTKRATSIAGDLAAAPQAAR